MLRETIQMKIPTLNLWKDMSEIWVTPDSMIHLMAQASLFHVLTFFLVYGFCHRSFGLLYLCFRGHCSQFNLLKLHMRRLVQSCGATNLFSGYHTPMTQNCWSINENSISQLYQTTIFITIIKPSAKTASILIQISEDLILMGILMT